MSPIYAEKQALLLATLRSIEKLRSTLSLNHFIPDKARCNISHFNPMEFREELSHIFFVDML
jgi:hypothetical protein